MREPAAAKLVAAHTVIEQGGQDSAVAQALERVRRRRFEQFAGLCVIQRRVEPSFPLTAARFTPSTGLLATALRSPR